MVERTLCRYTPPTDARLPLTLAALCLTSGSALWIALPMEGRWTLARIGASLLIAAGTGLAMRWLARCYSYTLEQHESGAIDLVVTAQQGRRRTTACRISTEQIVAIPAKKPRRTRTYTYANTPFPRDPLILAIRDGDATVCVRLTPGDEMARLLRMLCGGEKESTS